MIQNMFGLVFDATKFLIYHSRLDYPNLKNDKSRMEHFTSLCGVLFDFLGDMSLPNSAELMGLYGRVRI